MSALTQASPFSVTNYRKVPSPLESFIKKICYISRALHLEGYIHTTTSRILTTFVPVSTWAGWSFTSNGCVTCLGPLISPQQKTGKLSARRFLRSTVWDSFWIDLQRKTWSRDSLYQIVSSNVLQHQFIADAHWPFIQLSASDSPAVGHIGVSKMSCLACWHFLVSLQCAGNGVYTRGSHPYACFHWKYPDLGTRQAGLPEEQSAKIYKTFLWWLVERDCACSQRKTMV